MLRARSASALRLLIALVFLLSLCLSSGCGYHRYFTGFEEIPAGKVSVFVIRPNHVIRMTASLLVKVDNIELGYLQNAHFLDTDIVPGRHIMTVSEGVMGRERKVSFVAMPNQRLYFLADYGLEGHFGLKQIVEEDALQELREFSRD